MQHLTAGVDLLKAKCKAGTNVGMRPQAAVAFLGEVATPRKLGGSTVALTGVLLYGLSRVAPA